MKDVGLEAGGSPLQVLLRSCAPPFSAQPSAFCSRAHLPAANDYFGESPPVSKPDVAAWIYHNDRENPCLQFSDLSPSPGPLNCRPRKQTGSSSSLVLKDSVSRLWGTFFPSRGPKSRRLAASHLLFSALWQRAPQLLGERSQRAKKRDSQGTPKADRRLPKPPKALKPRIITTWICWQIRQPVSDIFVAYGVHKDLIWLLSFLRSTRWNAVCVGFGDVWGLLLGISLNVYSITYNKASSYVQNTFRKPVRTSNLFLSWYHGEIELYLLLLLYSSMVETYIINLLNFKVTTTLQKDNDFGLTLLINEHLGNKLYGNNNKQRP